MTHVFHLGSAKPKRGAQGATGAKGAKGGLFAGVEAAPVIAGDRVTRLTRKAPTVGEWPF